ncbi:hypothetical protein LCGC14_2005070, partial [marine sediment metagenome]
MSVTIHGKKKTAAKAAPSVGSKTEEGIEEVLHSVLCD